MVALHGNTESAHPTGLPQPFADIVQLVQDVSRESSGFDGVKSNFGGLLQAQEGCNKARNEQHR